MCDACWSFTLSGKPFCESCVHDFEWKVGRQWARFALFMMTTIGLAIWGSRHEAPDIAGGGWIVVVFAGLIGAALTHSNATKAGSARAQVKRRTPETVAPEEPFEYPAHPYRARFGRIAIVSVPAVSARTTTLLLGLALVAAAVLVPASLKLPRWLEVEAVLGAWWMIVFALLASLLHRGARLRDDHAFRLRWGLEDATPIEKLENEKKKKMGLADLVDPSGCFDAGCLDAEGIIGILVGAILAAAVFAASWLVVELAFPFVFFFVYWLVLKAIARVANDSHSCEKNLARSLGWGALWATVYTVPLALVVWGAHFALLAPK